MRRRVVAISVSLVALASLVFAGSNGLPILSVSQPAERDERASISEPARQAKRSYVEMKSDEGWQMEHNGKKIMVVVGNFAAHHNGTVITADSAVRYSERHIECFGNVLINKGSTYIYGDRAEYNGDNNEARVYSHIVKVVDGDATLYTYNFKFNTKSNIGTYTGGGVLMSGENMLESYRGYVYTDEHNVICVDRVQMRNDEYELMADSVVYNSETEYAQFFTRTNIWDMKQGDYLYADRGAFDKSKQLYTLTRNGYILTKEQELMCDTLNYYRDDEYVLLKSNIQIDDTSHKILMFGDWGEYWKSKGNVFITREPSVISYDTSQSDTVFMRSDSMFLNTRYPIREKIEKARQDSIAMVEKRIADSLAKSKPAIPKADATASVDTKGKPSKRGREESHARNKRDKRELVTDTEITTAPTTESVNTPAEQSKPTPKKASEVVEVNNSTGKSEVAKPAVEAITSEKRGEEPKSSEAVVEKSDAAVFKTEPIKEVTTPQPSSSEPSAKADSIQAQVAQTAKAVKEALKAEQKARAEAEKAQQTKAKLAKKARIDSLRAVEKAHNDSIASAQKAISDSVRRRKIEIADSIKAIRDEERRVAYVTVTTARLAEVDRQHRLLDSLQREKDLADSLAKVKADSVAMAKSDTTKVASKGSDRVVPQSNAPKAAAPKAEVPQADTVKVDSLKADSVKVDSVLMWSDTMTIKEQKEYYKSHLATLHKRVAKIKADTLNAKLDRIGEARQAKRTETYKRWAYQDSIYNARAQQRADLQLAKRMARLERRGIYIEVIGAEELRIADSILFSDTDLQDSLLHQRLDSLIAIYFPREIPSPNEIMRADSTNIDSMYREIFAYSRVKIFRSDFQSICDSLTLTSIDSIIHMYKLPILWNGNNQITSEVMHIKTHDSQLVRADFEGKPITASQLDTAHYNQVTGKEMSALFRENQIYRNDVNGNVQTIYYMQEDNSPEITLMAYIEAGDMTSYIENQEIVGITYRGNPVYTFYPIDKIPTSQPQRLDGFKWEAQRRPTKDSVFTRTIRPSMREEKRLLRRPLFPINAQMQQRKDDYMRRNEWRERTDTLSVETLEWLESIKSVY